MAFDPLLWWRGPWRAFIVQVECHVRGPCVAQGTPGGSGSARHDHEAAAARSRPGQHDSGSGVVSRRGHTGTSPGGPGPGRSGGVGVRLVFERPVEPHGADPGRAVQYFTIVQLRCVKCV